MPVYFSDTANIQINIYAVNNALVTGDSILCPGTVSTLNAYGGSQFIWSPTNSLSDSLSQQVILLHRYRLPICS